MVGFALLYCGWDWLRSETEESRGTTIRNAFLIIGGLVAVLLAIWRSRVSERQTQIANGQAKTALKQADTAHQSLQNERFQKGAEMLGSDVLAVRLGGIYALERLVADHRDKYYIEVMKLLCAFGRNPPQDSKVVSQGTKSDGKPTSNVLQLYQSRRLREDVQAAITAIGKRNKADLSLEDEKGFELDLRVADLRNAVLTDANLSGSRIFLVGADLSNALLLETDMSGADMRGAILRDTKLSGACMRATQIDDADLTGAKFNSMELNPTRGLTIYHLKVAKWDPDNPPDLTGVRDDHTNELLDEFIQPQDC